MSRHGQTFVMTALPYPQEGPARCGHARPTPGCHVCHSDQERRRRPGRLRGKGWTKSPKSLKRRRRRR